MRKLLTATLAGMAMLSSGALSAAAGPTEHNRRPNTVDPLHGFCVPLGACTGKNMEASTKDPPPDFGFTLSSGPVTGEYFIDILVPNSGVPSPDAITFNIAGTQGGALNNSPIHGVGTLVNPVAWSTGALDSYLGIVASPNNPIGSFLPAVNELVPDATGFYVYEANLGTNRIAQNAALKGPTAGWGPLLHLSSPDGGFSPNVPLVAYAVAFLKTDRQLFAGTANSGAVIIRKVPEPASLGLLIFGLGGLALVRRRRRAAQ